MVPHIVLTLDTVYCIWYSGYSMIKETQDIVATTPSAALEKLSASKVLDLLTSENVTKKRICEVISAGLDSVKAVVCDGEIHELPDYEVRRKYIELVLDVIGEKKAAVDPKEVHLHFTNVLQQVREYERKHIDAGATSPTIDIEPDTASNPEA